MKRMLFTAAMLASLTVAAMPISASAATSVGVSIRIGDPYRGVSLRFRSAPRVVVVPRTRVYVVRDYNYDLYRYDDDWYYIEDGYWYCADTYRGPYYRVRYASVPYQVRRVCDDGGYRWYRGGPPAHAPAHGYRRKYRDYDRDWDRSCVRTTRSRDWDRGDRDWGRDRDRDWDRNRDRDRDRDWDRDRDDDRDWRDRDR